MAIKNLLKDSMFDDMGDADNQLTSLAPVSQNATVNQTIVDNLTKQILGQGNTTNWQGGVNAQTAAKDMAKIMAGIGITDINQFGKVTQTSLQEDVRPDGRGGFVNLKGQQVDPAGVTPLEMDGNIVGYSSPTGTQETFGNKETGQIVPNTYAERQTGNAFGGTYEGKGNTAYRVDVGADGKPVFYTTGASSRDDISAFAPIIAAALTPVLGPAAASLLGPTASTLATGALTGAMVGGGTAAITGDSVLKGALLGGAGGALGDYLKAAGGATLGDASDIAMQMADSGATLPEIEAALTNSGFSPSVVAESLKDAANVLTPTATNIPSSVPSLLDTVSVVAPSTAPTLTNLLTAASTIPSITANQVTSPVTTPVTTQVTTPTAEQTITSDRPATVADIINSITAVAPTTTTPTVTTPVTTPTVAEQVITGQAPTTTTQDVINSIVASIPTTTPSQVTAPTTTPAVTEQVITADRPATVADIINSITSVAPVTTPTAPVITPTTPVVPEQVITANKPTTISDVINSIVASVTPTVVPPATTPTTPKTETKTEKDKSLGVSDVIRLAQIGTTVAALNAASNAGGGTNQYDIVPVPESWTTPTTTGTTTSTLPTIDFGNRNLLMGTQWEKLLNPNYGKIPTPVQYSQPSNLSYNDLMGILGSKSGMPSASSLSINDIISGIQNQYGQTPRSTMG